MPELPPPSLTRAIAQVGVATRRSRGGTADPAAIADARRNLKAAQVRRAIEDALATEPRLTLEQCAYLASLLASGRPL